LKTQAAPAQEHQSNDDMNKQLKPEARHGVKASRYLAMEQRYFR
jgi:hypothetical protein